MAKADRVPIVIAGGGLGGLASALAVARKGRASLVLEQARQFAEIGAGMQMAPNAFHVPLCAPTPRRTLRRPPVARRESGARIS